MENLFAGGHRRSSRGHCKVHGCGSGSEARWPGKSASQEKAQDCKGCNSCDEAPRNHQSSRKCCCIQPSSCRKGVDHSEPKIGTTGSLGVNLISRFDQGVQPRSEGGQIFTFSGTVNLCRLLLACNNSLASNQRRGSSAAGKNAGVQLFQYAGVSQLV